MREFWLQVRRFSCSGGSVWVCRCCVILLVAFGLSSGFGVVAESQEQASEPQSYDILIINSVDLVDDVNESSIGQLVAELKKNNFDSHITRIGLDSAGVANKNSGFGRLSKLLSRHPPGYFDLIIARGASALHAVDILTVDAFGGSPLIYYDVGHMVTQLYPNSTGILNNRLIGENIDLILTLFPNTEYIGVITDSSYPGQDARKTIKKILRYDDRVSAIYINVEKLSEEQIMEVIRNLPKGTCILLDSCLTGTEDRSQDEELLQKIISNPFCPVFSAKRVLIREGALGGVTYDEDDLYRVISKLLIPDLLVRKIKASDVNIDLQSSDVVMNTQAIKGCKFNFKLLPEDTIYENEISRSRVTDTGDLALLNVEYYSAPPLVWKNSAGRLQGALIDIWNLWARENNVNIKFIRKSGSEDNTEADKNVLLADIGLSEISGGDLQQIDFTDAAPFVVTGAALYQSSKMPVNFGWDGYKNKRIAIVDNDSFKEFLHDKIPGVKLVIYDNIEAIFSDLDSNKFEAFFMEDIIAQTVLRKIGQDKFVARNEFCTTKIRVLPKIILQGKPESQIAAKIRGIYRTLDKISFETKCSIIDRYNNTSAVVYPVYTEDEICWLEKNKKVIIGCAQDMGVLQSLGHEHIVGIIPDILRSVLDAAGITYRFIKLQDGNQGYDLLQEGKADILSYTSLQDNVGMLYSMPYLREPAATVSVNQKKYIGDNKSIVAIPRCYLKSYYFLTSLYSGNIMMLVESPEEAIELVEQRTADIALMSRLDAREYNSKVLKNKMHVTELYSMMLTFSAGLVDIPSNRILLNILNKGIITIPDRTIESLKKKYVKPNRTILGIRDIVVIVGPWILGLIIIVLALWGYTTRRSLHRLHESENNLQNEKAWLNATMYSIGEGVIATDVSGCVVQINFTAENILQCKESEVIGKPAADICALVDAANEEKISDPLAIALQEVRVVELQHNIVLINRAEIEIPITATVAPIIDTVADRVLGAVLVFRDIRAESAYRKQINHTRKMLSNAIELAGVSYFVFEVQSGKVIINTGRRESYLYVEDELYLADILPDIVDSDLKEICGKWKDLISNNIRHFHANYTSKYKGRIRFNRVDVRSEVDADSKIVRVFGVRLDVTDVVKAENVSRERLEQAYDLAKLLYYEYHPLTNTITVSPQLKKLFMLDNDAEGSVLPIGEVFKYVVPEDRERIAEDFSHIKNSRLSKLEQELRLERKNSRKIVKLFVDNKFTEEGDWIESTGCILDITELNYVQKELEVSEEQKRLILGSIKEGVVYINQGMEIMWANESTYEIFQCSQLKPLSEEYNYIIYGESKPSMLANTVGIMRGIPSELVESLVYKGKDLLVSLNPIRDASGKVTHLVKTFSDVSEFKEIQKNLREAYERAETANKAKSTFLSTMTHEIRTPLNAIIGFSGLLQYEQLDFKSASYANSIHTAASGLLSLINNVLDFSRMEANKITLSLLPMNLGELLDEMKAIFEVKANSKDLQLSFSPYEQIPVLVLDKDRLRQVLINILGNAIKFTSTGGIEVRVNFRQYSGRNAGVLEIAVKDTGIGIPLKDQKRMFESFEQHENSTTRRYEGTGLGLSISKRLVELMSGSIQLKSEVGKGSEFTIVFEEVECRTQALLRESKAAQGIESYSEGKVLLISNKQNDLTIVSSMLKKMGLVVATTSFIGDAFELLDEEDFGLIITSVVVSEDEEDRMIERLIEKSRELGVPVVALTGYSDPAEFFDVKMYDTVVIKPVTVEVFAGVIGKYFASYAEFKADETETNIIKTYTVSGLSPNIINKVLEEFSDSFEMMRHGVVINEAKKVAKNFMAFSLKTDDQLLINIAENFEQYVATFKLPDIMDIIRQFLSYKE